MERPKRKTIIKIVKTKIGPRIFVISKVLSFEFVGLCIRQNLNKSAQNLLENQIINYQCFD